MERGGQRGENSGPRGLIPARETTMPLKWGIIEGAFKFKVAVIALLGLKTVSK